ncbi:UbiA prenyltransferase family protein [Clostridium sp.]|uniref:UbiA prenyltransferase family protein n=1 Tax=Clostridium sp. TaxID=1506 RepID=UPI00257FDA7E|nr:UbiA prenyltransferase family protein [Clostridium sp.]MBS4842099.1 UbiA prenyltransferase family protein [Clostridium sp.]MDU1071278.1 UbiA prenyltransferase family protein [Clostridium sp.]MDU2679552.1 UbiA prenyltransferase family protein [Clostridium sp.]MDU4214107.1 UbiA prenyltransferase family protein [Clostridium sp.]MDU7122560.1 UbiA prenyltransferase family protein [Clostridium sp.]
MRYYLQLMRVHHYIKNILIFLPLVFSGNLFNVKLFKYTIGGFFAFSILSSIVYIINDIQDVDKDRMHSKKCNRPIAAGKISVKSAYFLSIIILFLGCVLNYIICKNNLIAWSVIFLYLILNFAYSIKLKNIPLLDITILVSGFFLRVLYGAIITNINVSNWLYLTIIFMSFYLALGKRRNELSQEGNETRTVLKYYTHSFLDKNMYMCLALTIVFYSLWCVSPINIERDINNNFAFTVPLVMLICMKYSLNIEGNSDGDPVSVILGDKILIAIILFYTIIILLLIY